MQMSTLILFKLLLFVVYLTSIQADSELKESINEKTDSPNPIDESAKSGELESDVKSPDNDHTSTETRIERSSESNLDKSFASDDIKTESKNAESNISTGDDDLKTSSDDARLVETSRKNDELLEINDAAEEISSERSVIDLNNDKLIKDSHNGNDHTSFNKEDDKTASDVKLSTRVFNIKSTKTNEKSVEDQVKTPIDSIRYVPNESHDTILDNKARFAENPEENLEVAAISDLGTIKAAQTFGSRRSNSGGFTSSSGRVALGRSGQIHDDISLQMPYPSSVLLNKDTNQDIIQPNEYFRSPIPTSGEFKSHHRIENYLDPISSSEFRPMEEFSTNPFSNAYPYALQTSAATTTSPLGINRNNEINLIPQITRLSQNFNRPIIRLFGENLQPLPPAPFKPREQNYPFSAFNPYRTRINQFPNQPMYYYKKCTHCP